MGHHFLECLRLSYWPLHKPLTNVICPEALACLLKNCALVLKSKIRIEDMAASMG